MNIQMTDELYDELYSGWTSMKFVKEKGGKKRCVK